MPISHGYVMRMSHIREGCLWGSQRETACLLCSVCTHRCSVCTCADECIAQSIHTHTHMNALPNPFRIHQYQCQKSNLFLTIGSPSISRVTHTHTHTHTHTQRVTLDANRHARTHVCIMRGRLHRIMRGRLHRLPRCHNAGRRCSLSAREHAVR